MGLVLQGLSAVGTVIISLTPLNDAADVEGMLTASLHVYIVPETDTAIFLIGNWVLPDDPDTSF